MRNIKKYKEYSILNENAISNEIQNYIEKYYNGDLSDEDFIALSKFVNLPIDYMTTILEESDINNAMNNIMSVNTKNINQIKKFNEIL
jgi:hypothetical protein